MLIKTEKFKDESGMEMQKEYFGEDENNITSTITSPVYHEILPEEQEQLEGEQGELALEEVQAQILLNQADIIAKQQEQDEVLAVILLNQMEGGERDV